MRELQFRAKKLFDGKIGSDRWMYGSNLRIKRREDYIDVYLNGTRCNPETLGQYVGTDSNDNNVYEGDILSGVNGSINGCPMEFGPYIVYWDSKKYGFNFPWWGDPENSDSTHYCKVIGNIHDNPELLK